MRRLALIIAITIAILSPAKMSRAQSSGGPRFVSLEGRFSISLPDRPSVRRLRIPIPVGDAYGSLYEWKIKEGTFGIGYADTFQPIKQPEAVKQLFDALSEYFRKLAEANGGKISVVKSITLDGCPGIEQRADLAGGSIIERTYLVTRRIYQATVVLKNSQREHESAAVGVLDSLRLLTDAEITEEALKAGPSPLPQTPQAPRAGSDASDEGLRGPVKSVRTETKYLSETPFTKMGTRSRVVTYDQKGNQLRREAYDFKNNLELIEIYGYLDGARVSTFRMINREYSPPSGIGGGGYMPSNRKEDPRYHERYEFKYDEKKRLIEKTNFRSNGDIMERSVYKYEGNNKEELVYSQKGSLVRRHVNVVDDKGNTIERTDFGEDGSAYAKTTYTYEFDSHGNWTKRTNSYTTTNEHLRKLNGPLMQVRTITYY